MRINDDDDQRDGDVLPVWLDADVLAWLSALSRLTGDSPGQMVAAMLRDIMVDDEAAHDGSRARDLVKRLH